MILFQDLNFWTAVGQLGMGAMAGVTVGVILRRVRYAARRPRRESRICPRCGAPALQRVSSARRAMRLFTRQVPYACMRCDWPSAPRTARKSRVAPKRSSDPIKRPFVETAPADTPVETPAIEAPPVQPPAVAAQMVEQREPAKPVAHDFKTTELEQPPTKSEPKDDATAVKESVYYYVALLNAGDVSLRANCYLSEFTTFGIDGTPLQSTRFERRPGGSVTPFDLRCRDLRVYIYKDTAIATGYLVGTMEDANGTPTRVTGRSTWVHLRQNGEWKLAHSHLSPLNPEA